MTVATTRSDFEALIESRIREADRLIEHGEWDGAYDLAGYAVEFSLKVAIISKVVSSAVFPDKKLVETFYKHDLTLLRKAADLEDEMSQDASVALQWDLVKQWKEQSRYEVGRNEAEARELLDAMKTGVVPWIKIRW